MSRANSAVSVLFADISGSVRLRQKLGDAEASRAVDRCFKRMERAVEVFGGRRVKAVGDRLTAVFDLPDQAFQAALQIQERVADLPPASGVKLAIRAGLAHGAVSEENGGLVGEAVDAAEQLAALAKPGQVLTAQQTQSALSPRLQRSTRDVGAAAAGQFPRTTIFELVSPAEATQGVPLILRYGDAVVILNERKPVIVMGRDAECDVAIHDRRASRQHAKIELRGERVVLVDHSTNGTYVTLDGQPELFLRGDECVIHGQGVISFASPSHSPDADCATFKSSAVRR